MKCRKELIHSSYQSVLASLTGETQKHNAWQTSLRPCSSKAHTTTTSHSSNPKICTFSTSKFESSPSFLVKSIKASPTSLFLSPATLPTPWTVAALRWAKPTSVGRRGPRPGRAAAHALFPPGQGEGENLSPTLVLHYRRYWATPLVQSINVHGLEKPIKYATMLACLPFHQLRKGKSTLQMNLDCQINARQLFRPFGNSVPQPLSLSRTSSSFLK